MATLMVDTGYLSYHYSSINLIQIIQKQGEANHDYFRLRAY